MNFAGRMKLLILGIAVAPAFALPSLAQTQPARILAESPKPNGKIFWLGTAALAAAKTYDAVETQALLNRGGAESDPLYGRHPSPARLGLVMGATLFGEALLFRLTERSKYKQVRWLGRGYITFTVAQHLRYGACDAGLNTHGPARSCHTF